MKTVGIVTEYNPFHKGHAYLIEEAKRKSGATHVVVVMSSSFVQRGEPAFFDKWVRTQAALLNGVDMVIELPVLFATASAEIFSSAAVRLLAETGIVDCICFGSENGELSELQEAAKLMTDETEEFRRLLKQELDKGVSYPTARSKALETITHISSEILSRPNDILALEYLKALDKYRIAIEPMTIKRAGEGYHSPVLDKGFASASAIRKGILEDDVFGAMEQVPDNCREIYLTALRKGQAPVVWSGFSEILHYKLRSMTADEIADIAEVVEGLENRILGAIETYYELEELMQAIKSKRYTRAKIQRILVHILLDMKGREVDYFMEKKHMPYIRVLGFKKDSAEILGDLTMNATCPVLTNLKKAREVLDEDGLHVLALEKAATDLFVLGCPSGNQRMPNQDFTRPMMIL